MKNVTKKLSKVCAILMFGLMLSCEKDEILVNETKVQKLKPLPNIEVNARTFSKNDFAILNLKQKFNSRFKSYRAKHNTEQNILEADFGIINLNSGVEIIDSLGRKTTTFEVKENLPSDNFYYNFVVQNDNEFILLKIEKTLSTINGIPANSTVITPYPINQNLSGTIPCPKIAFPPFGFNEIEDIVYNPITVGGGGITIGNINNPSGGFPSFGGYVGGFGGINSNNGSSGSNGTTATSTGSSSSGGGGRNSGTTVSLLEAQFSDFVTNVWTWIKNLFGGCKCDSRVANGYSTEGDLSASHRGLVLDIALTDGDCPHGFIYVIIQDAYVDKINSFEAYFSYLHNNDKVFLYENPNMVDDIELLLAANTNNIYLTSVLPELINSTRKGNLNWQASLKIAQFLANAINQNALNYCTEIIDLAKLETDKNLANKAAELSIMFESTDNIFSEDFSTQLNSSIQAEFATPPYTGIAPNMLVLKTYLKYKVLRQLNPTWSKARCTWEATKDIIHISLDIFGTIPIGGEVADITNGVLYTIEGDHFSASLSYAAAVPILGWLSTSTKFGLKVVNSASTIATKVKLVWKVLPNGNIYFGTDNYCRKQLRKVLGMVVGDGLQAHHIIPLNLQNNPIIQKAFKAVEAFHLNEALNGIPLSTVVHSGSHPAYDEKILTYLNQLPANATLSQSYNKVQEIIHRIRIAIANNPNTPINQLNF